jgi:hypothetical protein
VKIRPVRIASMAGSRSLVLIDFMAGCLWLI